jgi:Zn-dependent protease with chaperone function
MATNTLAPVCPQGHGAGTPGSRFCKWCGTPLVDPSAAAQPSPSMPAADPAAYVPPPAAYVPPAAASVPIPNAVPPPAVCKLCGGTGAGLGPAEVICPECGWLAPLFPGYSLDRSVFLWAQDGQAMMRLQKIPALHTVVRAASDRVGRPWIESTFNGIRLGPRQLPDVWKLAVLAARILGLPIMPDVYVAGDQMWNTYTFGSDNSAFIVLGTAMLTNFQHDELLFVLAREMGHCAAGHALWKTVTRFLSGDTGVHSGPLSGGILNAISPTKLIEGAVDMPLMAWSRQSDITADRAGLLAVGDEALARRVLLAWSIRSARLLKQVNIEEWMKQEDASDDKMTRISEMTTSSSMYTTRRLRLLGVAAREPDLMRWSESIQSFRKQMAPPPRPAPPSPSPRPVTASPHPAPAPADSIRVVCNKCQTPMRIPFAVLRGKTSLNVRCPQCENVLILRPRPAAPSPAPAGATTKSVPQPPAAAAAEP